MIEDRTWPDTYTEYLSIANVEKFTTIASSIFMCCLAMNRIDRNRSSSRYLYNWSVIVLRSAAHNLDDSLHDLPC